MIIHAHCSISYILTVLDFLLTWLKHARATRMISCDIDCGFKFWNNEFSPAQANVIQECSTDEGNVVMIYAALVVIVHLYSVHETET